MVAEWIRPLQIFEGKLTWVHIPVKTQDFYKMGNMVAVLVVIRYDRRISVGTGTSKLEAR